MHQQDEALQKGTCRYCRCGRHCHGRFVYVLSFVVVREWENGSPPFSKIFKTKTGSNFYVDQRSVLRGGQSVTHFKINAKCQTRASIGIVFLSLLLLHFNCTYIQGPSPCPCGSLCFYQYYDNSRFPSNELSSYLHYCVVSFNI
jgi:hypothetical protein